MNGPPADGVETLLLRADADSRIGAGHFMRSLALAEAWRKRGGAVSFVSRCENSGLRRRLEASGIDLLPIERSHPDPDDLRCTRTAVCQQGADWLVVDGYNFDPAYHRGVREGDHRLLLIDDCADLAEYRADIILNQNIGAERLEYRCDPDTTMLLGNRYALLRPEFTRWREWTREVSPQAANLLVTMGGSDPDNASATVVAALTAFATPQFSVKVVVGALNPHGENIRDRAAACNGHEVEVVSAVEDMAELMAWADMAVSAAGSTCWELAFMGLPSLLLVLGPDQRAIAEGMQRAGAAVHIESVSGEIAAALTALAGERSARARMSERCRRFVDGNGAARVVGAMRDGDPVQLSEGRDHVG